MKKSIAVALAVLTVASAGAASAQSFGQSRGPDRNDHRPAAAQRGPDRAPAHQAAPRWKTGERLPASYRDASHRVDHGRYGLRAPPSGYAYYRSGDDIVLTAIATGLIRSVLTGAWH